MGFAFTVTVRRGGEDTWGDQKTQATHTIDGCVKWPRASTEQVDFSQTVATGYMLSVPAGSDLVASDEVQLPGDSFWWGVEGDPLPWGPSPFTGREPGIIVALTKGSG
jgi:hypothetical protein